MGAGLLAPVAIATGGIDSELRLNQIQVIGTHNSYHVAPPEWLMDFLEGFRPESAREWDYTHPPLTEQLDDGVRQFELDLFLDPEGGLYAEPLALGLAEELGQSIPRFDYADALREPGTKVLHVQDVDFLSNTPTLRAALQEMLTWSRANPEHLPILVLLECKEQPQPILPTRPLPFTRESLLTLEREILEVMPRETILTPDDIRGNAPTLREAVRENGWPTIGALRGRFIFALDNFDPVRERYLQGNPSLEGRLLFVSPPSENHSAAAWFKRNNPVGQFDEIRRLVSAGFLVRTRSDSGPSPDPERRKRAFASGAQWISTDHYDRQIDPDLRVRFEDDALIRRNPISSTTP